MQEKRYLIEPVHLRQIKTQLAYRLRLQENVQELKKEQKEERGSSLLSKLKRLF